MTADAVSQMPLIRRLWIYQAERFPLLRTGLLLAVFTAASLCVSAHLASRPLPAISTFVIVWAVVFLLFFQMRACDEVKDYEDDLRFRPERPIQRGLISLGLIKTLGIICAPVMLTLTYFLSPALVIFLLLVWLWLGLMTVEFFVPLWLKARPFLYLASHMAIMPLIDLFITAAEWLPAGRGPPRGLWLFIALSCANGCVIEVGRKIWAPENERPGVETYSSLLGPERSAWLWAGFATVAYLLLLGVGYVAGALAIIALLGAAALALVVHTAMKFAKDSTAQGQKRIDQLSGLWVLACYSLAGFVPLLSRVIG
ncbi:UbiA family prenyltransferase [Taklimakanibacter lacteus]|uniref:UbiA family prenyltransferase n=1 Tax=Taklimakanibacter lacteus TaxID=2268456 RepID=UPI0034D78517